MDAGNRTLIFTNDDEVQLKVGEVSASPFILLSIDGIYTVDNKLTVSDNTMTDGATYQGSIAKKRNIVVTLRDENDHVANRGSLLAVFKSASKGQLEFREGDDPDTWRKIDYYVESVESTGKYGYRDYDISLICPDPFFYALEDISVALANWETNFHFEHAFLSEGEVIGYKSDETIKQIYNEQAADGVGVTITLESVGSVTNPSIVRVESGEKIEIGSESNPFTMTAGHKLIITTSTNNKHVYYDGVEINQYLTEDSVFLQLMRGYNTIGYAADAGSGNMIVSISYRLKFAGA